MDTWQQIADRSGEPGTLTEGSRRRIGGARLGGSVSPDGGRLRPGSGRHRVPGHAFEFFEIRSFRKHAGRLLRDLPAAAGFMEVPEQRDPRFIPYLFID
jgi:hypothetical protein